MKYRALGKDGWTASILGMGAMRLPTTDGNRMGPNIVESEAIALIQRALDGGVNYIDTAYVYHGGRSEVVVGKALQGAYRGKAKIATKSPLPRIKTGEDFDRILHEQLARLQTDHIDFYLLHGLDAAKWKTALDLELPRRAEAARDAGKIGHFGFSFHADFPAFQEILDGYEGWEFCQIQYNYMDTEFQAGTRGLQLAASKKIPVVAMEPVRGGRLAVPPAEVAAVLDAHPSRRTPVEWALHWVWNRPEVNLVLSGMSTVAQVEQNLAAVDRSDPSAFGPSEQATIHKAVELFHRRAEIPCTSCAYCIPCSEGVNIPRNFSLYNDGVIYDNPINARFAYFQFMQAKARASACTACGECEPKCPQQIPIAALMGKIQAAFGQ
jgi:predicted aldo/keto reductase-like oxidoreductase